VVPSRLALLYALTQHTRETVLTPLHPAIEIDPLEKLRPRRHSVDCFDSLHHELLNRYVRGLDADGESVGVTELGRIGCVRGDEAREECNLEHRKPDSYVDQ
jgi:hypothetical protein